MRTTTEPGVSATSGLVIVDKPAEWTSHDVVGRMRRLAGTRKVGHAGTLDPMATGVLVVGVNRATRLLGHLTLTDKEYLATIRLGASTITDDAAGEVTATTDASAVTDAAIAAGVEALTGDILQVPSAVSAIKVNGQRSYARVRAGEQVELAARPVTVAIFEVLSRRNAASCVDVDVRVECSSGTYIRALARDLGAALGVGGHLTALRRTRVGSFTLEDAHTLNTLAETFTMTPLSEAARRTFVGLDLTEEDAAAVRVGRALPHLVVPEDPTALFDPAGEFLALYGPQRGGSGPIAVFV
jgi:tRNA pseudouridine55 synthase